MANIEEKILADARSRKPQYADRMEVVEPRLEGLAAGLSHYSIRIAQLHDYIPINYIVLGAEVFTSLEKGDFARLLEQLRLVEEKKLSAMDLAILFLILEYPSRDRRLVEKPDDIAQPGALSAELREKLETNLAPPSMRTVDEEVEFIFWCYNFRTKGLERFSVRVAPDYGLGGECTEVLNLGDF